MSIIVRDELPQDPVAIAALIREAFASARNASGTEANIVEGLRAVGALTVSLVAEEDDRLVGHIAFSPVTIAGEDRGWYGLGPVAVHPAHQGKDIGAELISAGLAQLRESGATGCVLLGDPAYYERFGFMHDPRLILPSVPTEYFLALRLSDDEAEGEVAYHPAFAT